MQRITTVFNDWSACAGQAEAAVSPEVVLRFARQIELNAWSNMREWLSSKTPPAISTVAMPMVTRQIEKLRAALLKTGKKDRVAKGRRKFQHRAECGDFD